MPDWKEMYLTLMRETEKAVRILTDVQKKCEELYMEGEAPELLLFPVLEEVEEPPARERRSERTS